MKPVGKQLWNYLNGKAYANIRKRTATPVDYNVHQFIRRSNTGRIDGGIGSVVLQEMKEITK